MEQRCVVWRALEREERGLARQPGRSKKMFRPLYIEVSRGLNYSHG